MADAKNPSAIKTGRKERAIMAEPSGPVTPGNGHLDSGLLATLAHVEIALAALSRDAEPLLV